jgi:aminoglycoside N3'-acetyltransferase
MGLPNLSAQNLKQALVELGVGEGDDLLIHSALQLLGRPEGGEGMYLEVLEKLIGLEGTIAVPAFSFAFARGEDHDPSSSPSEAMGVFSELVRKDPRATRTQHPMQSLALIGKHSSELAELKTASAFDDGSAFDRMLEMDFKLLLMGAEIQAASIVHYSEQRAEVPYRYWKDFKGRVRANKNWEMGSYRMFVRDLEMNPELKLAPIQNRLEAKGNWKSVLVNYGEMAVCSLKAFVAATDELLESDPWSLVGNREKLKI